MSNRKEEGRGEWKGDISYYIILYHVSIQPVLNSTVRDVQCEVNVTIHCILLILKLLYTSLS